MASMTHRLEHGYLWVWNKTAQIISGLINLTQHVYKLEVFLRDDIDDLWIALLREYSKDKKEDGVGKKGHRY